MLHRPVNCGLTDVIRPVHSRKGLVDRQEQMSYGVSFERAAVVTEVEFRVGCVPAAEGRARVREPLARCSVRPVTIHDGVRSRADECSPAADVEEGSCVSSPGEAIDGCAFRLLSAAHAAAGTSPCGRPGRGVCVEKRTSGSVLALVDDVPGRGVFAVGCGVRSWR